jgi:hypothetical protein
MRCGALLAFAALCRRGGSWGRGALGLDGGLPSCNEPMKFGPKVAGDSGRDASRVAG